MRIVFLGRLFLVDTIYTTCLTRQKQDRES